MNCKPGEFAYVRAPSSGIPDAATGRVVQTVRLLSGNTFIAPDCGRGIVVKGLPAVRPPIWIVLFAAAKVIGANTDNPTVSACDVMWDHRLRPIRDPGDDARDETLEWRPVPTQEDAELLRQCILSGQVSPAQAVAHGEQGRG